MECGILCHINKKKKLILHIDFNSVFYYLVAIYRFQSHQINIVINSNLSFNILTKNSKNVKT